ncbi:uncharacterized protein LOC134843982 isoform X2 [Symsagittifera roscoffensis]|uniref:uncharacterized protein LOC134843982 isoform X2 n=1 Tax=Symsagittifera roscoffensis TaxID=84072 RepID=UPI00307BD3AE
MKLLFREEASKRLRMASMTAQIQTQQGSNKTNQGQNRAKGASSVAKGSIIISSSSRSGGNTSGPTMSGNNGVSKSGRNRPLVSLSLTAAHPLSPHKRGVSVGLVLMLSCAISVFFLRPTGAQPLYESDMYSNLDSPSPTHMKRLRGASGGAMMTGSSTFPFQREYPSTPTYSFNDPTNSFTRLAAQAGAFIEDPLMVGGGSGGSGYSEKTFGRPVGHKRSGFLNGKRSASELRAVEIYPSQYAHQSMKSWQEKRSFLNG